jgi:hypothetical protein
VQEQPTITAGTHCYPTTAWDHIGATMTSDQTNATITCLCFSIYFVARGEEEKFSVTYQQCFMQTVGCIIYFISDFIHGQNTYKLTKETEKSPFY